VRELEVDKLPVVILAVGELGEGNLVICRQTSNLMQKEGKQLGRQILLVS